MPPFQFPNQRYTSQLGLALYGMDEVLAENMLIIDSTFGAGSTVNVNGVLVANPNFNGTLPAAPGGRTNVVFQTDINGNVTASVANSSGAVSSVFGRIGAVTAQVGDYTYAQISGTPQLPITKAAVASNWLNSYDSTTGLFTATQPAASDLSNGTTGTGAVVLASAIAGFGTGTVTSVSSGNLGAIATVSVATATTTPAISFALSTQTANTVWAGPTSGGASAPTFRALGAGDIPSGTVLWNQIGNASGSLTLSNGTFSTTFNQTSATSWSWINTTAATSGSDKSSPSLNLQGNFWNGSSSIADEITLQANYGSFTNHHLTLDILTNSNAVFDGVKIGQGGGIFLLGATSGTLTLTPAATSATLNVSVPVNATTGFRIGNAAALGNYLRGDGTNFVSSAIVAGDVLWNNIGNATGVLTLANAGFGTTFNQTSAVNWTFANTTVATVATINASPVINLNANYWTGAASAVDTWTIKTNLTAGASSASTLTISHPTGSANAKAVISSNVGSLANATGITLSNSGTAFSAITGSTQRGVLINEAFNAASGTVAFNLLEADLAVTNSAGTGTLTALRVGLTGDGTYGSTTNAILVSGDSGVIMQVQGGASSQVAIPTTLNLTSGSLTDSGGNSGGAHQALFSNPSGSTGAYWVNAASVNATVNLTAQSAAIAATTILTIGTTGMYRISWSADITTAATTSSVLGGAGGYQVLYTSPTDSVVKTTVSGNSVTSAANTTGTAVGGCEVVYAKAGTNIQHQYGYTSVGVTAMVYELHVKVEFLGV